MGEFRTMLNYIAISDELHKQFCEKVPPKQFYTDDEDIMKHCKKMVDYWESKNPIIDMKNIKNITNETFFIKKMCEMKLLQIYETLEKHNLNKTFSEKYFKS